MWNEKKGVADQILFKLLVFEISIKSFFRFAFTPFNHTHYSEPFIPIDRWQRVEEKRSFPIRLICKENIFLGGGEDRTID